MCGVNQSWLRISRTISTSLLLYLMNLQNLRRLWMILINNLLMMIDLLGRLLVNDLRRRWVVLLINDVVLELCGGVWVSDQCMMSIAHWVVGAVFSRIVRWFIVRVAVRWVSIFAAFEATVERTVGQIEVDCCLIYRHLSDPWNISEKSAKMSIAINVEQLTAQHRVPPSLRLPTKELDLNVTARFPLACSVHKVFLWHEKFH